jgi:hypothetical protein
LIFAIFGILVSILVTSGSGSATGSIAVTSGFAFESAGSVSGQGFLKKKIR